MRRTVERVTVHYSYGLIVHSSSPCDELRSILPNACQAHETSSSWLPQCSADQDRLRDHDAWEKSIFAFGSFRPKRTLVQNRRIYTRHDKRHTSNTPWVLHQYGMFLTINARLRACFIRERHIVENTCCV